MSSMDVSQCRARSNGVCVQSPLSLAFSSHSTASDFNLVELSPYHSDGFGANWDSIDYERWNLDAEQKDGDAACFPMQELVENHDIPELSENYTYGYLHIDSYRM